MNAPGEIAPLARLARPHVAMITTVEAVHLAAFRDIGGIAREKAAIFAGPGAGRRGGAQPRHRRPIRSCWRAARRAGARPVRFGSRRAAGVPAGRGAGRRGRHLRRGAGARAAVPVPARGAGAAPGDERARRARRGRGAGRRRGAGGAGARRSGRRPRGAGARWTVLLGPGGLDGAITLIDESYNANPAAMAAAFEVFAGERPEDGIGRVSRGRRVAFLGDMLELGPRERELHAGLAQVPALARVDHGALRRRADAGALRRAARAGSAASGSRPPRRWRRARGGWSTPATSPWSRARSARGSAQVVEAIKAMGEARPAEAPEG